jgi:hypothetical protein
VWEVNCFVVFSWVFDGIKTNGDIGDQKIEGGFSFDHLHIIHHPEMVVVAGFTTPGDTGR